MSASYVGGWVNITRAEDGRKPMFLFIPASSARWAAPVVWTSNDQRHRTVWTDLPFVRVAISWWRVGPARGCRTPPIPSSEPSSLLDEYASATSRRFVAIGRCWLSIALALVLPGLNAWETGLRHRQRHMLASFDHIEFARKQHRETARMTNALRDAGRVAARTPIEVGT